METDDRAVIMAIDDTVENLKVLEGMLADNGYGVRSFASGPSALRAAAIRPPDLILLDVLMPEMDGYEVCALLKADDRTSEIPVIFLSALSDVEDKVMAFRKGGVDYVTKPFRHEDVLARVQTHLGLRRLRRELQERNEQLASALQRQRALEKARDDLVHMLVHDLRSPLTAIACNLDMFLCETTAAIPDDEREMLVDAHSATERLTHMVSEILDVSKLEAGALEVNRVDCELQNLVREVVAALEGTARGRELLVMTAEGPCVARVDPGLTGRILTNLVGNAVKFTPAGGRISVGFEPEPEHVKVLVSDTGPGIAPEHHELIFDKFGQVEARRQVSGHSTGLGLTFCKLAVEAQHGRIGLESTPGCGSTFWVRFPRGGPPG